MISAQAPSVQLQAVHEHGSTKMQIYALIQTDCAAIQLKDIWISKQRSIPRPRSSQSVQMYVTDKGEAGKDELKSG